MRFFSLAAVVVSVLVVAMPSTPTRAQRQTVRTLATKIEAIERDLDAIKRYLAYGDVETGQAGLLSASDQRARAAEIEVRLNEIEVEFQTLTGRVEETGHQVRLIGERLEKLAADWEFRLSALESSSAGVSDAASGAADEPGAEDEFEFPAEAEILPLLSPTELYEAGRTKLRGEEYQSAEVAFREFIQRYPNHELAANAQYWLGHSFYQRRDFENAARVFLDSYESYADEAKGPDSLLKLGMSLNALGQTEDACAVYREFETRYPDTEKRLTDLLSSESRRAGCS